MAAALAIVLVVAVGWWAHEPGLDGVLVLDDVRAIVRNQSITSLSAAWSPPDASTVAGRPVGNLSLALNYALTPADVRDWFNATVPGAPPDAADRVRRNVRAYHVGNLVIHLVSALLLFGVVRRTLLTPGLRERAGGFAAGVAGLVALLWAWARRKRWSWRRSWSRPGCGSFAAPTAGAGRGDWSPDWPRRGSCSRCS